MTVWGSLILITLLLYELHHYIPQSNDTVSVYTEVVTGEKHKVLPES